MPIIEPVPIEVPLSQGNILKGVRLFATAECWNATGGQPADVRTKLCLVLSRPCVAQHKRHVTVAAIERYKGNVPGDIKTFDDILGFLVDTRDGVESPDVFYLGEIPAEKGRFCARLDSVHSMEVPGDPLLRQQFLTDCRVGRLHIDFARDLHARIFRAFASLGFDDLRWFATPDLEWLVGRGRAELAETEQDLHQKQTVKAQKGFEGKEYPPKEIEKAEAALAELRAKLAPYEEELRRRQSA